MTTRDFIFILLVTLPSLTMAQKPNKDSGELIVKHGTFVVVEDNLEPPPPNFTSPFKTLEAWLINICDNDKPKKPISTYHIGLFESPDEYTLYLIGQNTYDITYDSLVIRNEFEPKNMFFNLPVSFFKHLDRQSLLNKLTLQLKHFATTEKFKQSFFTKADNVIFDQTGQNIWSKQ